jgi:hypothetical protein
LTGGDVHLLGYHSNGKKGRADDDQLRVFLSRFGVAWFIDASYCARNVKVYARHLRRHQVHVVIEGDREQEVGFTDAGVALDVYIDPVALDQFDALELGSSTQPAGFFVYYGDLVAPLEKRGYCS